MCCCFGILCLLFACVVPSFSLYMSLIHLFSTTTSANYDDDYQLRQQQQQDYGDKANTTTRSTLQQIYFRFLFRPFSPNVFPPLINVQCFVVLVAIVSHPFSPRQGKSIRVSVKRMYNWFAVGKNDERQWHIKYTQPRIPLLAVAKIDEGQWSIKT